MPCEKSALTQAVKKAVDDDDEDDGKDDDDDDCGAGRGLVVEEEAGFSSRKGKSDGR